MNKRKEPAMLKLSQTQIAAAAYAAHQVTMWEAAKDRAKDVTTRVSLGATQGPEDPMATGPIFDMTITSDTVREEIKRRIRASVEVLMALGIELIPEPIPATDVAAGEA